LDEKKGIARAAGLISVATLISRILGYVKDMILARYFGATGTADTFFVAFRIPNLLRELFAEGAMSSACIPVLTEYQTKHGRDETKRLVRIIFTFILTGVGLICCAGILFAPGIVKIIAPGFASMPEKFSLTVTLTRIMFPFLLFISLAALVMGALNTRRIFFIPALAPATLNITIIILVLLFATRFEQPIYAVAFGVALGGLAQFAFQLPSFFQSGYSFSPDFDFKERGLRKMAILMVPATMGMAVAQVNIFVSTILASYLPEGSITYLYYSMRLIQFPIGIFGVAMGMAVLPALSEHAVRGDFGKLREDFSYALRVLFFITVPAMAGLIALREPIVHILFQRGQFDYAATVETAEALLYYSLGIWSIVGVRIVTAGFYSMQDTKTPVKIAAVAVAANIIFSVILMQPLKHSGLALANTLASGLNFFLLFILLRKRLVTIDGRRILSSFGKSVIASAMMGTAAWFFLQGTPWHTHGDTLQKALYLSGVIISCIVFYLGIIFLLKSEELNSLIVMVRKKLGK
jgi:putative peptidoglycan lipid II flippase